MANEIEEFPADEVQEFDLSDEFARPPRDVIDVGPEVRARKKQFLAGEMEKARAQGRTAEQVSNLAGIGEAGTDAVASLPANILNLPTHLISALTGSQPIEAKRGESLIPEILPSADTLAKLKLPPLEPWTETNPSLESQEIGPAAGGSIKAAEDLVRGVATPEVVLTAGAGAAPGMLARAPAGAFAAQMTQHLPESAAEAGRLSVEGTPAEAIRAGVGTVGTIAMLGHMAAGGAGGKMSEHGIEEFPVESAPSVNSKALL